jgi:hypothetical protein
MKSDLEEGSCLTPVIAMGSLSYRLHSSAAVAAGPFVALVSEVSERPSGSAASHLRATCFGSNHRVHVIAPDLSHRRQFLTAAPFVMQPR